MEVRHHITRLLKRVGDGDFGAREELLPLVHAELQRIAARHFKKERNGHTLEPGVLADEAFMELSVQRMNWDDRKHFFAVAALAIRRILVKHARDRKRLKRGGEYVRVTFQGLATPAAAASAVDVLALDEALEELRLLHARQARVVELHFYGGLEMHAVAEVLGVSLRTTEGDWSTARAFLFRKLNGGHCA